MHPCPWMAPRASASSLHPLTSTTDESADYREALAMLDSGSEFSWLDSSGDAG